MATENLRAIRFLGSSGVLLDSKGRAFRDGIPVGIMRIGKKVYGPGDEITDRSDLEQLGAARLQDLVNLGQAQFLDSSPKPLEDIRGELSAKDRARAEAAAAEAEKYSEIASITWKADLAAGFIDPKTGELTAAGRARIHVAQGGFQK